MCRGAAFAFSPPASASIAGHVWLSSGSSHAVRGWKAGLVMLRLTSANITAIVRKKRTLRVSPLLPGSGCAVLQVGRDCVVDDKICLLLNRLLE